MSSVTKLATAAKLLGDFETKFDDVQKSYCVQELTKSLGDATARKLLQPFVGSDQEWTRLKPGTSERHGACTCP